MFMFIYTHNILYKTYCIYHNILYNNRQHAYV